MKQTLVISCLFLVISAFASSAKAEGNPMCVAIYRDMIFNEKDGELDDEYAARITDATRRIYYTQRSEQSYRHIQRDLELMKITGCPSQSALMWSYDNSVRACANAAFPDTPSKHAECNSNEWKPEAH